MSKKGEKKEKKREEDPHPLLAVFLVLVFLT